MIIKDKLLEKFNNGEAEGLGIKRICELFSAKSRFEKNAVIDAIYLLESEGKIVYDNGRFVLFENSGLLKGTLKGNERGFAFVITDNGDYFIPPKYTNGALNGDTVIIKKVISSKGSTDEAKVTQILKRGLEKVVGTFDGDNRYGFVIPDDRNFNVDVYIPLKKTHGAKKGDKVVAKITSYPENKRNPEGVITEIIGKKYDLRAEELSIIKAYDLPLEFPENVERELLKIQDKVLDKELLNRTDFRDEMVVTIDGEDSRDFDDAVYVKKTKSGFTLKVHIADVSHYVKMGSPIFLEALNRSTSVYFPERVIPMLPKKLSNGICSLNEGVDRLTLSVIMDIDFKGVVKNFDIKKGVIRSKKRFTYTTIQSMIDGDSKVIRENKEFEEMVNNMLELQTILTNRRNELGNIDLNVKESHIYINNENKIVVEARKSARAYKIIEEFMIVTNETVAEYVYFMNLPFIYRVHEKPQPEKVEGFKTFLKILGITVKWNSENCYSKDYQILLDSLRDKPIFNVVNKVMLRSMQKAKYSPENQGHFGLSSKCYSHFTSPIRRFPDLVIHSIIKDILDGKDVINKYSEFVYEASNTSSQNERKADEVERMMDDYYKCRYMKSYIGYEYDGIISGVTNFGVFVELENSVEGLVLKETLPKGNYVYDEKTFSLRSGIHSYSLGDSVKIKVLGVNLEAKKIHFKIL